MSIISSRAESSRAIVWRSFREFLGGFSRSLTRWPLHVRDRHGHRRSGARATPLHGTHPYIEATLRWTTEPAQLQEVGTWRRSDDPELPSWLLPFDGAVLVATDPAGRYAAGVGIKKHNRFGHELAVHTDPDFRNRGLARALVAQAARHVLAAGAIPIYVHDVDNAGSAHVAEAAGFPERGWRWLGLAEQPIRPAPPAVPPRRR
jgi:GNAT superfamily N-acetyltransferase